MRSISTLILFGIMFSFPAFSQRAGKIYGLVKDQGEKPLSGATVSLLTAKDSALVKSGISEKDGTYEFDHANRGRYLVSVTSVGFMKQTSQPFDVDSGGSFSVPVFTLL